LTLLAVETTHWIIAIGSLGSALIVGGPFDHATQRP